MEQAKKRDHKIFITDIAIQKVSKIIVPGLEDTICQRIYENHIKLLQIAKNENNSNEVLCIMSVLLSEPAVFIKGSEFKVDPSENPWARSVYEHADRGLLIYLHNHPSTNKFSLPDIITFIQEGRIGTMTVITNQGEIYFLHKTATYDYHKAKEIFMKVYQLYMDNKMDHYKAAELFLKKCNEGGIFYGKAN